MHRHSLSRRRFLAAGALTAASPWLAPLRTSALAANERLNLAFVGIANQGGVNLRALSKQNVVALCDVDEAHAAKSFAQFPMAKKYTDFRKMLDENEGTIDGVVISTPDHTHFHPAWSAMERGKPIYLEKPMAHTVWEVRQLTEKAAAKKVATQLGVQRHMLPSLRRAVELLQGGAIGNVTECHAWVSGSRGMPPKVMSTPPVPDTLAWDLWLGPAAERPYAPDYCPYKWRFWWDFGTGETGNWGCHILDIPFWGLNLKYPTRVEASGPPVDPERTPTTLAARYDFPSDANRGPVTLHWYHGAPPILKEKKLAEKAKGMNNLFIGSEGMLLAGFDKVLLLPEEVFADKKLPEPFLPKPVNFHGEWVAACKGGPAASCDFSYSGPLTETVLLGNVAYRSGKAFHWDAAKLKADEPAADALIRPNFRKGWEV